MESDVTDKFADGNTNAGEPAKELDSAETPDGSFSPY